MLFDYFDNFYDSYNFEKERREHWLRLERDAGNWVLAKPSITYLQDKPRQIAPKTDCFVEILTL